MKATRVGSGRSLTSRWRLGSEPFPGLVHLSRPPETVSADCAGRGEPPGLVPPPFFAPQVRKPTTSVIRKEVT